MMKIVSLNQSTLKATPCVATIGNFDGLHLGHQTIIQQVVSKARELSLTPTVITFEPLPQSVLKPKASFVRLMKLSQKLPMLAKMGIEQVICLRFSPVFSQLSPMAFIEQFLVNKIALRHLFIGEGFRFGYQQSGTVQTLMQGASTFNYEVQAISHHQNDNSKISSTQIRTAILESDFSLAQKLLGRDFSITARVVKGAQRGRALGFATANLASHPAKALLKGVYVTKVHIENQCYYAVANSGTRPTVDGTQHVTEVHILDFSGNLYGKKINVEFLHKLRDEKRFDNIEQLKQHITMDVQKAREFLNTKRD